MVSVQVQPDDDSTLIDGGSLPREVVPNMERNIVFAGLQLATADNLSSLVVKSS